MSELIDNGGLGRKDLLKHLILRGTGFQSFSVVEDGATVRTYFRRTAGAAPIT